MQEGPGDRAEGATRTREPSSSTLTDSVVLFLGTSLTAGFGLPGSGEAFPEVIGMMMDSAEYPYRIVNAGVSGETSAGGLRRLEGLLDLPLSVLVIELGANDGLRGQSPGQLRENLETIIDRSRERHPHLRLLLAGMEAPPNLGPEYTATFREVYREVADTKGVELIPFLLDGVAGLPELNQADGIHPTAEGHARVARLVWPYLERLVERR